MTALSVANPYPVVSINDGFNPDKDNKQIKQHMDRDKAVEGSLNPQFFQCWELDAIFPQDWKLELAIKDKGMFEFSDPLIGAT